MNDQGKFSWLRSLGHSAAIGVAFLSPALILSAMGVVNAEKAGEFSAGFIFFGLVLGWFWSFARQTGKTTSAHVLVFALVAMSAYQVFVLAAAALTRGNAKPVSAFEANLPIAEGTEEGVVLCQGDVGLKLPLERVSLSPAPDVTELLRQKNPNQGVARWAYREPSGDIVVLMASVGFDSEESLRNFLKGASQSAEGRMEKVRESVDWAADGGSIVLSLRQGGAARFDMRCISDADGRLACIQTLGSGPDKLEALRERLGLGSCR